ncbi:hypothetical protein HJG60_007858 [Phyllostomus discolor]|uniref:Uncharacterized protein n=1 Tax=Phyllostomus discolor TaxID=89673 RepID=A0A834BDX2_9CHIR|nr:hypothetical protein HJG60_007858 [Phyllostomus discolor]
MLYLLQQPLIKEAAGRWSVHGDLTDGSRSVSRMPGSDQLLPSWGWHQNDINRQTDGVRKQRRKSPKSWNSGNYLPERGEGREARICKRNINWLPLSRPEGGTKPAAQPWVGDRHPEQHVPHGGGSHKAVILFIPTSDADGT